MKKRECIAMLLAGGQGSRLGVLTKDIAKPAVPFGGKYRIIDFPLSNCINSGVDTVGVLTQYQPLELSEYIGSGKSWDLDRLTGGVHILPPHQKNDGAKWYKGTADAIYQNIPFIKRYNPRYVLVLSGDHIYKMDYSKMLKSHIENRADCTISVLEVPIKEASRFGIMNINEDGTIYEFEEKPEKPKSNLASMGIYIFTTETLMDYLEKDAADKSSAGDFGKNVIPAMLKDKKRLFAYKFKGYWKDVGTINSLWEANMDLLNPKTKLSLSDSDFKIYSSTPSAAPQYIGDGATVENCLITAGCNVLGSITSSVLFENVSVEKGATVRSSLIMPGAKIKSGATVLYSVIGENTVVESGATVGSLPKDNQTKSPTITVIGSDQTVV